MDNFYLSAVVSELRPEIVGRRVARLYARNASLIIDFKLLNDRVLIASLDPSSPALYISKAAREDVPANQPPFILTIRKKLAGARLVSLEKAEHDRLVRLEFEAFASSGLKEHIWLVLMLTGRSANAYLTDSTLRIESMFAKRGRFQPGEQVRWHDEPASVPRYLTESVEPSRGDDPFGADSVFGPLYKREFIARSEAAGPAAAFQSLLQDLEKKPRPLVYSRLPLEMAGRQLLDPTKDLILSRIELEQARGMHRQEWASLSEAADEYYRARARSKLLADEFNSARKLLAREITKCESALDSIANDRARFEGPERFKRSGDLILANLRTARVVGSTVSLVDYFDPDQPTVQIEIDAGETLQRAAARYFSRYQHAKRGLAAVVKRELEINALLERVRDLSQRLEREPTAERLAEIGEQIRDLFGKGAHRRLKHPSKDSAAKTSDAQQGRRFVSSDGYEIVVGRNDIENDRITFRVAKSRDLWLHAADYAGSHVVIRNPGREDVPQRSILEAAELAAFYSQAKRDGKVAVHCSLKKFVSKPPRAKPGLVRLSSFKTLIVEPRCKLERLA